MRKYKPGQKVKYKGTIFIVMGYHENSQETCYIASPDRLADIHAVDQDQLEPFIIHIPDCQIDPKKTYEGQKVWIKGVLTSPVPDEYGLISIDVGEGNDLIGISLSKVYEREE